MNLHLAAPVGFAFVLGVPGGQWIDMGEVVDPVSSRFQCNFVATDEAVEWAFPFDWEYAVTVWPSDLRLAESMSLKTEA